MKKNIYLIVLSAVVALFLTSCKKDNGTVTLIAQIDNTTSSKAFIDFQDGYPYACWSNGDQVRINGGTYTVAVSTPTSSTQKATIDGVTKDEHNSYYAFYPGTSTYLSTPSFGDRTKITLPSEIQYEEVAGVQIIRAPMAAKADANNVLKFKCLTTLLRVDIPNGNAILNRIIIQSGSSRNLSGKATVNFSGTTPTLGSISTLPGDSYSDCVTMTFGDGITVLGGLSVYIPIPAAASGDVLRIYTVNNSEQYKYVDITVGSQGFPANTVIPINGPEVPALSGYQFFSWIQSDSSGWIDLGLEPSNNAKFEIEFMLSSPEGVSGAQYLTGSREDPPEAGGTQYFTLTGPKGGDYFQGTFYGNQCQFHGWTRQQNVLYRESMEVKKSYDLLVSPYSYRGYLTFQRKRSDGSWQTYSDSTAAVNGGLPAGDLPNIYVFAIQPRPNRCHKGMRLYRYRMWLNGTLQHDFVPCQRTSDGAIGVYDMAGGNGFREPHHIPGAPAFTVGND